MFSCPGNWVSRFRKVIDSSCWICGGLLEQFSYSGKFVFWSSSSRNQAWTAAPLKSQLSFQLSILTLWCTYLHSLSWLVYLLLKKAMGLWPCMVFCFVLFLKLFFLLLPTESILATMPSVMMGCISWTKTNSSLLQKWRMLYTVLVSFHYYSPNWTVSVDSVAASVACFNFNGCVVVPPSINSVNLFESCTLESLCWVVSA